VAGEDFLDQAKKFGRFWNQFEVQCNCRGTLLLKEIFACSFY